MLNLNDKVALITGAAHGIGQEIATAFAKKGAKVVLADIDSEAVKAASNALNDEGYTTVSLTIDVSKAEDINRMIDQTIERFGQFDLLVNNAGILDGFEPVGEISDEKWDYIFEVNTNSVMRAMRRAINYWTDNNQSGNIINIISAGALNGTNAGVAYGASKQATLSLTKNTAFMYAKLNIRVNGIAPGAILTRMRSGLDEVSQFGMSRTVATQSLIPKYGHASDIAEAALFLGSDVSKFVNGTIVTVDGGWTAGFH